MAAPRRRATSSATCASPSDHPGETTVDGRPDRARQPAPPAGCRHPAAAPRRRRRGVRGQGLQGDDGRGHHRSGQHGTRHVLPLLPQQGGRLLPGDRVGDRRRAVPGRRRAVRPPADHDHRAAIEQGIRNFLSVYHRHDGLWRRCSRACCSRPGCRSCGSTCAGSSSCASRRASTTSRARRGCGRSTPRWWRTLAAMTEWSAFTHLVLHEPAPGPPPTSRPWSRPSPTSGTARSTARWPRRRGDRGAVRGAVAGAGGGRLGGGPAVADHAGPAGQNWPNGPTAMTARTAITTAVAEPRHATITTRPRRGPQPCGPRHPERHHDTVAPARRWGAAAAGVGAAARRRGAASRDPAGPVGPAGWRPAGDAAVAGPERRPRGRGRAPVRAGERRGPAPRPPPRRHRGRARCRRRRDRRRAPPPCGRSLPVARCGRPGRRCRGCRRRPPCRCRPARPWAGRRPAWLWRPRWGAPAHHRVPACGSGRRRRPARVTVPATARASPAIVVRACRPAHAAAVPVRRVAPGRARDAPGATPRGLGGRHRSPRQPPLRPWRAVTPTPLAAAAIAVAAVAAQAEVVARAVRPTGRSPWRRRPRGRGLPAGSAPRRSPWRRCGRGGWSPSGGLHRAVVDAVRVHRAVVVPAVRAQRRWPSPRRARGPAAVLRRRVVVPSCGRLRRHTRSVAPMPTPRRRWSRPPPGGGGAGRGVRRGRSPSGAPRRRPPPAGVPAAGPARRPALDGGPGATAGPAGRGGTPACGSRPGHRAGGGPTRPARVPPVAGRLARGAVAAGSASPAWSPAAGRRSVALVAGCSRAWTAPRSSRPSAQRPTTTTQSTKGITPSRMVTPTDPDAHGADAIPGRRRPDAAERRPRGPRPPGAPVLDARRTRPGTPRPRPTVRDPSGPGDGPRNPRRHARPDGPSADRRAPRRRPRDRPPAPPPSAAPAHAAQGPIVLVASSFLSMAFLVGASVRPAALLPVQAGLGARHRAAHPGRGHRGVPVRRLDRVHDRVAAPGHPARAGPGLARRRHRHHRPRRGPRRPRRRREPPAQPPDDERLQAGRHPGRARAPGLRRRRHGGPGGGRGRPDSPADGVLEAGDIITAIDGETFDDPEDLSRLLATTSRATRSTVTVQTPAGRGAGRRGRAGRRRPTTPTKAVMGVRSSDGLLDYDFPFDVEIDTGDVGGPSAGLAFTLGLIDDLTPGDLTGGTDVAGHRHDLQRRHRRAGRRHRPEGGGGPRGAASTCSWCPPPTTTTPCPRRRRPRGRGGRHGRRGARRPGDHGRQRRRPARGGRVGAAGATSGAPTGVAGGRTVISTVRPRRRVRPPAIPSIPGVFGHGERSAKSTLGARRLGSYHAGPCRPSPSRCDGHRPPAVLHRPQGLRPREVRAFLHELSDLVGRLQRGEAHEHERAERAEERATWPSSSTSTAWSSCWARRPPGCSTPPGGRRPTSAPRPRSPPPAWSRGPGRGPRHRRRRPTRGRGPPAEILAEADALRREAEDEVERRRVEGQVVADDMRREAEAERERMLADGERARAEAEAAAEQIRASAREQGRRLVGEAQAVRERMLADLARRRRTAREQLERLNGARERLLAAYEVVKRTVDEATTELTVALPEAKAGQRAGHAAGDRRARGVGRGPRGRAVGRPHVGLATPRRRRGHRRRARRHAPRAGRGGGRPGRGSADAAPTTSGRGLAAASEATSVPTPRATRASCATDRSLARGAGSRLGGGRPWRRIGRGLGGVTTARRRAPTPAPADAPRPGRGGDRRPSGGAPPAAARTAPVAVRPARGRPPTPGAAAPARGPGPRGAGLDADRRRARVAAPPGARRRRAGRPRTRARPGPYVDELFARIRAERTPAAMRRAGGRGPVARGDPADGTDPRAAPAAGHGRPRRRRPTKVDRPPSTPPAGATAPRRRRARRRRAGAGPQAQAGPGRRAERGARHLRRGTGRVRQVVPDRRRARRPLRHRRHRRPRRRRRCTAPGSPAARGGVVRRAGGDLGRRWSSRCAAGSSARSTTATATSRRSPSGCGRSTASGRASTSAPGRHFTAAAYAGAPTRPCPRAPPCAGSSTRAATPAPTATTTRSPATSPRATPSPPGTAPPPPGTPMPLPGRAGRR